MPLVLQVALYKNEDKTENRGTDFFKSNNEEDQKHGRNYVRVAGESIHAWAFWFDKLESFKSAFVSL